MYDFLDGLTFSMSLGLTTRVAHVHPVSVHACASSVVAISTLPATVSLAFGVPVSQTEVHAQLTYWFISHVVSLYINSQFSTHANASLSAVV